MSEKSIRLNAGKPRWSLLHYASLEPLVKVMEFGEKKYSRGNWQKGLDLQEIQDSTYRHLNALNDGELYDKETGLLHSGHIMANMMMWNYHFNKQQEEKKELLMELINALGLKGGSLKFLEYVR